jgi:hypothetical protein
MNQTNDLLELIRSARQRCLLCDGAAMLAQRPNDARVSGAGPPRKTFFHPRLCKAPHPLQPIVRRLTAAACAIGKERAEFEAPPDPDGDAHRRGAHRGLVFSGLREAAAPHMPSPKRVGTWRAAVTQATDAAAGMLAHQSLSPRRVRHAEACTGGA